MSILNYNPTTKTYRDVQVEALQWVEAHWDKYDVLVIDAPVAMGKSLIATTIAEWVKKSKSRTTSILTSSKLLQDQYHNEFPSYAVLKGMTEYQCDTYTGYTCEQIQDTNEHRCQGCGYTKARETAVFSDIVICNYYSFFATKLKKDVMIIDEAHNILSVIQDLSYVKFWKHKDGYESITTISQFLDFLYVEKNRLENARARKIDSKIANKDRLNIINRVIDDIEYSPNDFSIAVAEELYRGEMKECVSVRPLSIANLPSKFWKNSLDKVILLSATISEEDLHMMGLDKMKMGIFKGRSPIPKENRPVYYMPVTKVNHYNMTIAIDELADAIKQIANQYPNDKGLVHVTYSMGLKLSLKLTDSRYLTFTNQSQKKAAYEKFRASKEPLVLIAAGMAEGIDLADDAGRFQIITKIQYPNLGDKHVSNLSRQYPSFYKWITARTVLQQTGRICRNPNDRGDTYIIDSSFTNFYREMIGKMPTWFNEAFIYKQFIKE